MDYEKAYRELLEVCRPSRFMDKATDDEAHAAAIRRVQNDRAALDKLWKRTKQREPGITVEEALR